MKKGQYNLYYDAESNSDTLHCFKLIETWFHKPTLSMYSCTITLSPCGMSATDLAKLILYTRSRGRERGREGGREGHFRSFTGAT